MHVSQLIRDAARVHSCLQELPDGRVIAKKGLRIQIPTRFVERNLGEIGADKYIVGIYAMITEDGYYAVSLVNAMHQIDPVLINKVVIDETEYFDFVFTPGSTVFKTLNLVRNRTLVYYIYDELVAKGHVPWYVSYEDMGHIFETAGEYAGTRVGKDHESIELLVSMIARDPVNRARYYRQAVTIPEDQEKIPVAWVPLKSVTFAATNTLNKIAGSYMQDGIVSALVSPATRTEHIESLLRR